MVIKSRALSSVVPYKVNGVVQGYLSLQSGVETMSDSSETGSPLTDSDPVDKFLRDPTNRSDFHKALRESSKTPGDLGLSDFRVDRDIITRVPATFSVNGVLYENWYPRSTTFDAFPALTRTPFPNEGDRKVQGERLYNSALPNQDQSDLGTTLAEIVLAPKRAIALPGFKSAEEISVIRRSTAKANDRRIKSILHGRPYVPRTLHPRLQNLDINDAKAVASDYLAYIFGTRPTVDSLNRTVESVNRQLKGEQVVVDMNAYNSFYSNVKSAKYLAQSISRDGTRRMRRRREGRHTSRAASQASTGYYLQARTGSPVAVLGTGHKFVTETTRNWFAGAFRMSTVDTDTWLSQCSDIFDTIDRVTGLGLDPKMAWDLIPFSFMADWFSNTGDFLSNRQLIGSYNIVCEYGYYMTHFKYARTFTLSGVAQRYPPSASSTKTAASVYFNDLSEVKLRSACSSFGFHAGYDGLNAFQWGALTALGLSNVPGVRPLLRK